MRLAPVDLGACIDQVLQEIATEIAVRDTEVEVSRPFGHVLAQRTTVQQVLISFITDGLKFVSKGTGPRVRL